MTSQETIALWRKGAHESLKLSELAHKENAEYWLEKTKALFAKLFP